MYEIGQMGPETPPNPGPAAKSGVWAIIMITVALISLAGTLGQVLIPHLLPISSSPAQAAPANVPPSSSSEPPAHAGSPLVNITEPLPGAIVYGDADVAISGNADNMADADLWIFVQSGDTYYVNNGAPLVTSGGTWQFTDPYVGPNSSAGLYEIYAIIANTSCDMAINSGKQQPGGGVKFQKVLPVGCTVGDEVTIRRVAL